jgi:hypothetical protein
MAVSGILQPDAGFDGHKGQGYHTQIMDTHRDDEYRASELTKKI